ncbi:MAG: DNA-processing protein DprA, partial [Myxococcota bacterium]
TGPRTFSATASPSVRQGDMYPTDLLVLSPHHPSFPVQVRAMSRPPERLYLRGALPVGRSLAIVGSRRATAAALAFARHLAAEAVRAGWSVWSGGALGIDTAAHQGALEAGGTTVVVMGTGFGHLYPTANRELFDRVLACDGAWLSPYPPNQPGSRWTFLPRNELLASLADEVVIVQAPARSGARSTMAAARRMGKGVWAVPASPWDDAGAGCLEEIRLGAKVLLDPSQVVGKRPRGPTQSATLAKDPSDTLPKDLCDAELAVVRAVGRAPATLDDLCVQTGLQASAISAAALTLTLRRILFEAVDGTYHRVRT